MNTDLILKTENEKSQIKLVEQDLWMAVLEQAIIDIDKLKRKKMPNDFTWTLEAAKRWVNGINFKKVCELALLDPDYIRKKFLNFIDSTDKKYKKPPRNVKNMRN